MIKSVLMLLLLPVMACEAQENKKIGLGMWVWHETAFNTAEARSKLLSFCAQEGIVHLDQHIDIKKEGEIYSIQEAHSLKTLIIEAEKQDITMNALRGGADTFLEKNHETALRELQTILEFDTRLPADTHLNGVKYDVEPYGTTEWKAGGKQREKVILDYLSFLQKANALLEKHAPHLKFSVDVPFWWDSPEFTVSFNGSKKLLIQHVQDLTDYITIMSYRPSSKQVIKCIKQEMKYAQSIDKSICPALETGEIKGKESWISFWERPPASFQETLGELQNEFSKNKAVRCIMLHHYSSLLEYLDKTPSKP